MTAALVDHDGKEQRIEEQHESFVDEQRDDAERNGAGHSRGRRHGQECANCKHSANVEQAVEVA